MRQETPCLWSAGLGLNIIFLINWTKCIPTGSFDSFTAPFKIASQSPLLQRGGSTEADMIYFVFTKQIEGESNWIVKKLFRNTLFFYYLLFLGS